MDCTITLHEPNFTARINFLVPDMDFHNIHPSMLGSDDMRHVAPSPSSSAELPRMSVPLRNFPHDAHLDPNLDPPRVQIG